MRVLVCGARDYQNWQYLSDTLDKLHLETPITCVIEGEAAGADTMGRLWAQNNNVVIRAFPADWKKHGRAAGPIRNKQMLDEGHPELVVAFFNTSYLASRGTRNMCEQAEKAGVKVIKHLPEDQ